MVSLSVPGIIPRMVIVMFGKHIRGTFPGHGCKRQIFESLIELECQLVKIWSLMYERVFGIVSYTTRQISDAIVGQQ